MTRNLGWVTAIAILSTLLVYSTASASVSCPGPVGPNCTGPQCYCNTDTSVPGSGGDPVDLSYGNSIFRRTDFKVPGTPTSFEFTREFTNTPLVWNDSQGWFPIHLVGNIPRPFGEAPDDPSSALWWDQFYSFVYVPGSYQHGAYWAVVDLDAHPHVYTNSSGTTPVCSSPCWAPLLGGNSHDKARLYNNSSTDSFVFFDAKGHQITYDQSYVATVAGYTYTYVFPSKVLDSAGRLLYTITYARPFTACPYSTGGNNQGVPYINTITTADGVSLQFHYSELQNFGESYEQCVISEIDIGQPLYPDGGSMLYTPAVVYQYYPGELPDAGTGPVPGLLAAAVPGDGGLNASDIEPGEQYEYSCEAGSLLSCFTVQTEGFTTLQHLYDAGGPNDPVGDVYGVVSGSSLSGSWTINPAASGQSIARTCGQSPTNAVAVVNSNAGNGTDNGTAVTETETLVSAFMGGSYGMLHEQLPWQREYNVANQDAGVQESDWGPNGCSSTPALNEETWVEDRNGNWLRKNWADGGQPTLAELTSIGEGISSWTGTDALKTTNYTYTYDLDGQQHVATESKPSWVSGQTAVTTYAYDSNGRLKSVIRSGYTTDGVTLTNIGTFYFTSGVCEARTADPLNRVLEVHGPCLADSSTSGDCKANVPVPITSYYYYLPSDFASNHKNKLAKINRWVGATQASCSGTGVYALTTTYDTYDIWGNPTSVTDVNNNVVTHFAYDQGRVVSKTQDYGGPMQGTTSYTYENGKLTSIQHPTPRFLLPGGQGDYEVYCYRNTSGPPCSAAAAWTGQLQWKAKAGSPDGTNTWELVTYSYWDGTHGSVNNGTLRSETYYSYITGSQDERRVVYHAADAEVRPSFDRWGDQGSNGSYVEPRLFDGVGNVVGLGLPFNNANDTTAPCGGILNGVPADAKCAALTYDRVNRLSSLVYPVTYIPLTSTTVTDQTCFTWDGGSSNTQGNYLSIKNGCGGVSCSACNLPSASYVFDDFGNLIESNLPWMGANASSGTTSFTYDATGNLLSESMPAEVFPDAGGSDPLVAYGYDTLGREVGKSAYRGTWMALYTKTYDNAASATGCPSASSAYSYGRLQSQVDTVGTTFFDYNSVGDLVGEQRFRVDAGSCAPLGTIDYHRPNTQYTYDFNHNLEAIVYPMGRTVQFAYDGGNPDRVSSVYTTLAYPDAGWSATTKILDKVAWEPYAGLRGYEIEEIGNSGSHTQTSVEYALGDAGPSLSSSSCPWYPSASTSDHSGRVSSIWVADHAFTPGTGSTPVLYEKNFEWKADQVMQTATCAGTATVPLMENFGYDMALRLTQADGGGNGGPYGDIVYDLDEYNRRNDFKVNGNRFDYSYNTTYDYAGPQISRVYNHVSSDPTALEYVYSYYNDGSVASISGFPTLSGTPYRLNFVDGATELGAGGAGETNVAAVAITGTVNGASQVGAFYNYFYDAKNRRSLKKYPTGISDEFFYDLQDDLIYDQGNSSLSSPGYFTEDDYVWLGGRPVAMVRGVLSTSWRRMSDWTSSCGRNGDTGACGVYFPITDHIQRPVVMLDSYQRVAGLGEYDPFGQVNRAYVDQESWHNVVVSGSASPVGFASYTQPTWGGFTVATRPRVNEFDGTLDGGCGSYAGEGVSFTTPGYSYSWALCTLGGYVFPYLPLSSGGTANVSVYTPTTGSATFWGAMVDWWEYRRYGAGVTPLWTPLRFPGQYHDEETDLNQNWNRFYNPMTGSYLEPEPLLTRNPAYTVNSALRGEVAPVYAYAANNPVNKVDPNGMVNFNRNPYGKCVDREVYYKWDKDSGGDEACQCWIYENPANCRTFKPRILDTQAAGEGTKAGGARCIQTCRDLAQKLNLQDDWTPSLECPQIPDDRMCLERWHDPRPKHDSAGTIPACG